MLTFDLNKIIAALREPHQANRLFYLQARSTYLKQSVVLSFLQMIQMERKRPNISPCSFSFADKETSALIEGLVKPIDRAIKAKGDKE